MVPFILLCGMRAIWLQIELLQKHPHILVGTPGRILDLVDDGALILRPPSYAQPESSGADAGASRHLAGVAYVVLDEADKMLGLGFQPQLDRLRALLLPAATATGSKAGAAGGKGKKGAKAAAGDGQGSQGPRPQVALLTATMPPEVAAAAAVWLSPNVTSVTISHSAASISRTITQVWGLLGCTSFSAIRIQLCWKCAMAGSVLCTA